MRALISRLTLEQRLVAINAVIFLVIVVVATTMMTQTWEVPASPPMELIERRLESIGGGGDSDEQRALTRQSRFRNVGARNIFPSLIPVPTPTPTPPPTPPPDPSLEEAIRQWKVKGMFRGVVFIEDPRTREEFHFDLDDPATITRTIRFKNEDMVVRLDSVDSINLAATFSYTGRQGKQQVTRGMFEE
ncbi:MAG: hypothetical protein KF858_12625 [Candidatus Sumerlaeia bacterium]|nr:hypothetical protein [Candidatus Sumerlaeia bacterium]